MQVTIEREEAPVKKVVIELTPNEARDLQAIAAISNADLSNCLQKANTRRNPANRINTMNVYDLRKKLAANLPSWIGTTQPSADEL